MFRGINLINLDTKGRLAIPSRYREHLQTSAQNKLVVTIDTEESCLLLYPFPSWKVIEEKIEALSSFNQLTRRIQRLLIGHATEIEMDSHGRILLPPLLRNYASLAKDVMLIGQGKKFEIWDEQQWEKKRSAWLTEGIQENGIIPDKLLEISL
jgi:MraZ protein